MPRPDFTLPRLLVTASLDSGVLVPLDRDQANYLMTVLRLGDGDPVLVFNGRDGEWRSVVRSPSRRAVSLAIAEQTRPQPEPPRLTYAFAPLKHARLDYMVQKAVEMGAGILQPVLTRRTQVSRVNLERMRGNVVEAAEQCGVLAVPEVAAETRFDAWIGSWPADDLLVFCDEDAEVSDPAAALLAIRAGRAERGPMGLLIGPEGGFDEGERGALLRLPHVVRLSLGPRILRADTAAVAALSIIQATLGDWR